MPVVPSTYSWPTLSNWQVQYQGTAAAAVVFGALPIFLQDKGLEGFDLPATRTGDSNRPRARGEFIGLDEFSGRDLTLTLDIGGSSLGSYATTQAALNAIIAATNTADVGNVEYPMFVQIPNRPLLGIMAKARKRAFTPSLAMSLGSLAQGYIIQWHATDPFFYSQTTTSSIGLPTPGTGMSVNPLSFPISFGAGGGSSILTLTNAGDVECYPQLTVTGPCTYPSISNLTTGQVIQFGVTMATSDKLVIDTDLKTATYYAAGSPNAGYSVMSTILQGWSWWNLAPGATQIQFASTDSTSVAGTLAVAWASAYSSVL